MEKLIEALDELNAKMKEINVTLRAITEDLERIEQPQIWGDERDNKNEDSNLEREQ